jgi:hypothetical protein
MQYIYITSTITITIKVSGVYVAAFYLYLFTGAAPTATINGTAVSLIPKTSIAGSGVQFSFQNTGRLLIPAIGGLVIDLLGDKVMICMYTQSITHRRNIIKYTLHQ